MQMYLYQSVTEAVFGARDTSWVWFSHYKVLAVVGISVEIANMYDIITADLHSELAHSALPGPCKFHLNIVFLELA